MSSKKVLQSIFNDSGTLLKGMQASTPSRKKTFKRKSKYDKAARSPAGGLLIQKKMRNVMKSRPNSSKSVEVEPPDDLHQLNETSTRIDGSFIDLTESQNVQTVIKGSASTSTCVKMNSVDVNKEHLAVRKVRSITKAKSALEEARLVQKVKDGVNISLYSGNKNPEKSVKGTGFANRQKAVDTIKICARDCRNLTHQKQIIVTMFNRAKHHPHRTKGMEEAMTVFAPWLKKHGLKADF